MKEKMTVRMRNEKSRKLGPEEVTCERRVNGWGDDAESRMLQRLKDDLQVALEVGPEDICEMTTI
jgi:hypothetical protein